MNSRDFIMTYLPQKRKVEKFLLTPFFAGCSLTPDYFQTHNLSSCRPFGKRRSWGDSWTTLKKGVSRKLANPWLSTGDDGVYPPPAFGSRLFFWLVQVGGVPPFSGEHYEF